MKKIMLSLTMLTTLAFCDENALSIPLEEAVQINTKLIKVLFDENKQLKEEIDKIKENTTGLMNSQMKNSAQIPTSKIDIPNENKQHQAAAETRVKEVFSNVDANKGSNVRLVNHDANIRDKPSIKNSSVLDEKKKGDVVECTDIDNTWCKLKNGGYIWEGYLSSSGNSNFKIIVNKKTNIRKSPQINKSNISSEVDSGTVFTAVSYKNGWYQLENGNYVSDINCSRYNK